MPRSVIFQVLHFPAIVILWSVIFWSSNSAPSTSLFVCIFYYHFYYIILFYFNFYFLLYFVYDLIIIIICATWCRQTEFRIPAAHFLSIFWMIYSGKSVTLVLCYFRGIASDIRGHSTAYARREGHVETRLPHPRLPRAQIALAQVPVVDRDWIDDGLHYTPRVGNVPPTQCRGNVRGT